MNERKEPTISSAPPSKEDLGKQQTSKNTRAPQRSAAHSPAARPLVVKSKMAPVAFLFALLACGGAGFLYWQLGEAQKLLADADLRIADLEGKFELSDDESSASMQTMQAKLKWADSEIRKLWGVSFDVNKKAITSNKSKIAQVEKASSNLNKKVQASVKSVSTDLRLVSDLVDAQQTSLSSIENRNAAISKQAAELEAKIKQVEALEKSLQERIETNEQAIEAIDAFRRNINQQILQLRGGA